MASRAKLFALCVAVAFLTRLVVLAVPIVDLDEAAYLTAARELLRGRTLYLDVADHKPPLVFLYYAAAQWLLGAGMLGVRLLTHLVTVPLVAYAASAFHGHGRRGGTAAVLFLVGSASFLGHDMLAVNCEQLMLAPLALSVLLLRDAEAMRRPGRLFGFGLLVGLATLFKYQAAAWAVAPALVALAEGGRAHGRRLLLALAAPAAGLAVPPLIAYALFAGRGAGEAFLYWNLDHNLAYAAAPVGAESLGRLVRYVLPFLAVTAPLWWACRASWPLLSSHHVRLLASLLALSLAASALGFRFYPHYLIPLYLPLALGAAPWAEARLARPPVLAGRAFVAWAALALAGFSAANAYLYHGPTDVYVETRPVFRQVAARLRADPCFGTGPLFVWGFAPIFYSETGLSPASRFLMVSFSLVGHVSGGPAPEDRLIRSEHWDWLMSDLERRPPTYLLETSRARLSRWAYPLDAYPRLARFVASGYRPLDAIGGVRIYRRRGCPGS